MKDYVLVDFVHVCLALSAHQFKFTQAEELSDKPKSAHVQCMEAWEHVLNDDRPLQTVLSNNHRQPRYISNKKQAKGNLIRGEQY